MTLSYELYVGKAGEETLSVSQRAVLPIGCPLKGPKEW